MYPVPIVKTKKKRKLGSNADHGDIKRIKQERARNDGFGFRRRVVSLPSLARRSPVGVLREVLVKAAYGDQQMAVRLLREFSLEHLPTVRSDLSSLAALLLQSATVTKHDEIAGIMLRMLLTLLQKAELSIWTTTIENMALDNEANEALFNRLNLAGRLLEIAAEALNRQAIQPDYIPPRIARLADRSLRFSGSTQARISALQFHLARTLYKERGDAASYASLERILCTMSSDRDPRVRCCAVDGLLSLAKRENSLTIHTYHTVRKLNLDSERHVRIGILELILPFANTIPTEQVTSSFGKEELIQLCDDAFSIVCHAVNDMEVEVRTRASTLLGQFTVVSDSFLDQTLDKKLMRAVKTATGSVVRREAVSMFSLTKNSPKRENVRWKSWQQKKSVRSSRSEWASGKDLNAPCPSSESGSAGDEDNIMPQGACGAFVTALEDEFRAVRTAAVYSLGKLAAQSPNFAMSAVNHLADMFNDENAKVRLDAIHALTPLVTQGQLQKGQLEVVLNCLHDASWEPRHAMISLLSKVDFPEVEYLIMTTKALINCLNRFRGDKDVIYKCMSELGVRHGVFVHTMVRGLLNIHAIFDQREPHLSDVFYIGKLLLVLNAASSYAPIVSLLPQYVFGHYRFIQLAMPHLLVPVKVIEDEFALRDTGYKKVEVAENMESIVLRATYGRLRDVYDEYSLNDRNTLRGFLIKDATAICAYNEPLAGSALLMAALAELSAALESLHEFIVCSGETAGVRDKLEQQQENVLSALYRFYPVPSTISSFLIEVALHLSVLLCIVDLMTSARAYATIIENLRVAVQLARDSWLEADSPCTDAGLAITATIADLIDGNRGPKIVTVGMLGSILSDNPTTLPSECPDIDSVFTKWAHITAPHVDLAIENPTRFVTGLPAGIPFIADLHNFDPQDESRIRIQIVYPDLSISYFRPRHCDFEFTDGKPTKLSTKVLMSAGRLWFNVSMVHLTLVLASGPELLGPPVPMFDSSDKEGICTIKVKINPL